MPTYIQSHSEFLHITKHFKFYKKHINKHNTELNIYLFCSKILGNTLIISGLFYEMLECYQNSSPAQRNW